MAELTNRKGTEDLIVGKIHGAWRCDGRLGSGAFGIIHVWSNINVLKYIEASYNGIHVSLMP